MKVEQIFDKKLADILDKYSDVKESMGSNLLKAIRNSKEAEIIIPVLGMQGMGKSTLINGLLKENILPNDADETTCVPVEVKYGEKECAVVHFFNQQKEEVVNTREELNKYVDNNCNPANEKQVARIELFRKIDFLKGGLVIVDLPGVGSMTKENENTTKRYVENLCSAIFVIPTVPPIREKEAFFIKSLWSQFSKAIFVQNDWDESKATLSESVEYNNKILRKIAEELNNPYDNEIVVVNAYNAIKGALENDSSLRDSSNINSLHNKIMDIASNWDSSREDILLSRINLSIQFAKNVISKRLSDLKKSQAEREEENAKAFASFKQGTNELLEKVDSLKKYLRDQEDEVYQMAKRTSRECAGNIRVQIYTVIDKGVYDGENLTSAFNDIQEEETKDLMKNVIDYFQKIKIEVESKFSEIQQIEIQNDINLQIGSFQSNSSTKWENGLSTLMSVGGAVAGYVGAAPLLAACGVAGPAGWVVAGVGAVIWGVFSLFGNGIKKVKQSDRANEAKKQIAPHIDDLEHSLKKAIPDKFDEFKSSCFTLLDKVMSDRRDEEIRYKNSLNQEVDESQEQSLREDLNFINNVQNEIVHV